MGDDDQPSLEYIEDSYLPSLPPTATPSLDDPLTYTFERDLFGDDDFDGYGDDAQTAAEWSAETELFLRSMPLEHIFCIADEHHDDGNNEDDMQRVEAELSVPSDPNGNTASSRASRTKLFIKRLFTRKSIHDVRVTFIDLSKPYLAKMSSNDNYKSFLNIGNLHGGNVFFLHIIYYYLYARTCAIFKFTKCKHIMRLVLMLHIYIKGHNVAPSIEQIINKLIILIDFHHRWIGKVVRQFARRRFDRFVRIDRIRKRILQPQYGRARTFTQRMEPRAGSCRRGNHDVAYGANVKNASGRRSEA